MRRALFLSLFAAACGDSTTSPRDAELADGLVADGAADAPVDPALPDAPLTGPVPDAPTPDASVADDANTPDRYTHCRGPDASVPDTGRLASDGGGPGGGQAGCSISRNCSGYLDNTVRPWDPCRPTRCNITFSCSYVFNPPSVADGTPCDDNRAESYAYPCNPGTCPANRCVGGTNPGAPCVNNAGCTGGGKCVVWICDAVARQCKALADTPPCNPGTCPTEVFCAGDRENLNGFGACETGIGNGCSDGSSDIGPCVRWTCNAAAQRCESRVPCVGGPHGVGSACNDVCLAGVCSSDYRICK